jgi:uncharacterized RDD family membrane protein YckC
MNYANFFSRFVAFLIDSIVLVVVCAAVRSVYRSFYIHDLHYGLADQDRLYYFIGPIVAALYYILLESGEKQATFGKRMLGIYVVDEAGGRISLTRALIRYFSKYLSALVCFAGYIMALFTKNNQTLHDKIATTYVVNK